MQQREVTFDCPSCGAPIHAPDTATALKCDYCGNIVINTGSSTSVFGGQQPVVISRQGQSPQRVVQGRGCVWGIVALVIVIVLASVVPAVLGIWSGINAI